MSTMSTRAIVVLCLPQFIHSFIGVFFDSHLTRFYLHDICSSHSDRLTCFTPAQLGLLSSVLQSLGLFVDVFISHVIVESGQMLHALNRINKKHRSLGLIVLSMALLYALSHAMLFNTYIINPANLTMWYMFWMFLRNIVPLQSLYGILLQRISLLEMRRGGEKAIVLDQDAFRSKLFGIKLQLDLFGGIAGGFVVPLMYYIFGIQLVPLPSAESGTDKISVSYTSFSAAQAVMLLISYALMVRQVFNTAARRAEIRVKNDEIAEVQNVPLPFLASMKQSFRNVAFRNMLALFVFEALRGLLWNGLHPFYFTFVLQLRNSAQFDLWNGIFHTTGTIVASLCVPFWMRLSNRIGVHRCWILTYQMQIVIGGIVHFAVGKGQVIRYLIFFVLQSAIGRASGFLLDLVKSRVFDYDQMLNHDATQRREASIESLWSLLPRYIGLPASQISLSIMEHWGRYAQNETDFDNEELINTLRVQNCLLPAITSLICLYIMSRFPVNTEEKHRRILDTIAKRMKRCRKMRKDSAVNTEVVSDPITQKTLMLAKRPPTATDVARNSFFDWEIRILEACKAKASGTRKYHLFHWTWKYRPKLEASLASLWLFAGILLIWFATRGVDIPGGQIQWTKSIPLWFSSVCFSFCWTHAMRWSPACALSNELRTSGIT